MFMKLLTGIVLKGSSIKIRVKVTKQELKKIGKTFNGSNKQTNKTSSPVRCDSLSLPPPCLEQQSYGEISTRWMIFWNL